MSVAAVMLVKDERDVIEYTLSHLAGQVDAILVMDNGSTDGTPEILNAWEDRMPDRFFVYGDPEIGYWQSRKTTELAERAAALGFDYVLPCDADEMWVAAGGRPIRDFLLSIPPDVQAVEAQLFHYIPTAEDPSEAVAPSPFARIGWRLAEPSVLPKVCCRLGDGLVIEAGNHGCTFNGSKPRLTAGGLRVNHYSWRSADQYARKIVNGARAYAATDLPPDVGPHWRMWGDPNDPNLPEYAAAHFRKHFWACCPPMAPGSTDPRGLVYDPAVE